MWCIARSARGYEIAARLPGARISRRPSNAASTTYVLDEENDVKRLGGKAKINPPIRPRAEVEKLWRHVADGNVTLVSTDHVSWSENRKTNPDMLANASGVPGLEVMVPLFVKGALERGIPLTWAAELMALNPARHFRLDHRKGALERRQGRRHRRPDAGAPTPTMRRRAATTSSAGRPTTASGCRGRVAADL